MAREGTHVVARSHLERIVTDGQEHELKLGVWVSNQKQRRHTLTEPQRAALTELGVGWAH
ncbi:helicase associated domain-containing protein [Streptomyces sp. NBC_01544]|uniref:helicase associated domain-containing protein n=1 Tax=Streptomyces sp. NBC_01544 TaxID=2975871 RepID=UPI003868564F